MAAQVGGILLSVGLSLLSNYLLRKKKSPFQDERPPSLATRGTFAPWISGRRRVGTVTTWVGQRHFRKEALGTGKGSGGGLFGDQKQRVWYESAMHVLAVGPCTALRRIEAGGEVLFDGLITPDSHPSGSAIPGVSNGTAIIYWGEDDQAIPDNNVINVVGQSYNLADEIGVQSRWPGFCYIHWVSLRLGPDPIWPAITVDLEKTPSGNHLSNTDPTVSGENFTLSPYVMGVDNVVADKVIDLDLSLNNASYSISVQRQALLNAQGGGKVRLTGNSGLSDRDFTVVSVQQRVISSQPHRIFVEESTAGMTNDGTITPYESDAAYGANAAHSIADMLFEPQPYGSGQDPDDWDLDSLEDLGTLMQTEALQTSWVATEGRTVADTIGPGLQDLSVMMPIDPQTGKVKFVAVRKPTGTLRALPNEIIMDRLPELEKSLAPAPADFLIFKFSDQDTNYRDMTLGRMEDGQIGRLEAARARTIEIVTTTHFDSAVKIADRRSQEDFVPGAIWSLRTGRESRMFFPGEPVIADFSNEVLRVVSVRPRPESGSTDVKVMVDAFGVPASEFADETPPDLVPTGLIGDANFDVVEPTEFLDGVPPQSVVLLRHRFSTVTLGAYLHISSDDTTFTYMSEADGYQLGGTLDAELPATGEFEPADSTITFTLANGDPGGDVNEALDLSSDDTNWRLGRQLCVIVSSAGTEVCYLQKLAVASPTTRYLQGLIRARAGTVRLTHPAGARVYILQSSEVEPANDPLLAPGATRYFKSQPYGAGSASLVDIESQELDLYGYGVRPMPVSALRVVEPRPVNAYASGEDVSLVWDYSTPRTPGTSAGFQDAGDPVGLTAPEGDFQVEILNLSNTVVATYASASASFDYSNASIIADLGSQVGFKVRVTQLRDGYSSDPTTITVEKI